MKKNIKLSILLFLSLSSSFLNCCDTSDDMKVDFELAPKVARRGSIAKNRFAYLTCKAVFKQKYNLYRHERLEHKKDSVSYACDHCNNTFASPSRVQSHKIREHPELGIKTDHHCDVCNKYFTCASDLSRHNLAEIHKRRVAGVDVYDASCTCSLCGNTFASPSRVQDHKIREHPVLGIKTDHHCGVCNKYFAYASELSRHNSTAMHKLKVESCELKSDCSGCMVMDDIGFACSSTEIHVAIYEFTDDIGPELEKFYGVKS